MTESEWLACTDPGAMLDFLRGMASDRKLRLFACAGWRWRYARSGPRLLRWTVFRLLLGPLCRTEDVADGSGELRAPAWWGTYTFALPEAREAAHATVETFRDEWPRLYHWPTEWDALCRLLRDLFGPLPFRPARIDPAWLAWNGRTVRRLAESAYDERAMPGGTLDRPRLAVLADALEEAGCDDAEILGHLRGPGPCVRGCWALDLLLGK